MVIWRGDVGGAHAGRDAVCTWSVNGFLPFCIDWHHTAVATTDVEAQVMGGLRLPQPTNTADPLYDVCTTCWCDPASARPVRILLLS